MGISGLLVSATLGLSSSASAAGGANEQGLWYNNSGKGAVEIRPCATTGRDANKLCGFIVWLKQPNGKNGQPLTDGYNSDPSKRKRPICGLPVLGALQRVSEGGYDNGWVYDPEQGQAFDAAIQLSTADKLVLTGYKGIKFFSKSFVWKRAPADLPSCTGTAAARETKNTVGTVQAAAVAPAAVAPAASAAPAAAAKTKVAAKPVPPPAEKAPGATLAKASAQPDALTPPRPVPAVRPRAPIE